VNKTKKLLLKKSAPDSVGISQGMEFSKTFKRENEPFSVSPEIADMLLRSHDEYFMEAPEEKAAETPAKASKRKSVKKAIKPKADDSIPAAETESSVEVDPNKLNGSNPEENSAENKS